VTIAERFAENLARQRQVRGLSQEELAARADIHRTQISLIEGGKRMPRLDTLVKLAGALEIEPGTLLDGIVWEPTVTKVGQFRIADPAV
jgi:transcriptional regulator with XRE-family HTH domain